MMKLLVTLKTPILISAYLALAACAPEVKTDAIVFEPPRAPTGVNMKVNQPHDPNSFTYEAGKYDTNFAYYNYVSTTSESLVLASLIESNQCPRATPSFTLYETDANGKAIDWGTPLQPGRSFQVKQNRHYRLALHVMDLADCGYYQLKFDIQKSAL